MPWWSILYLVLFWLLALTTIIENISSGRQTYNTPLDLASAILVTFFTYSYFHQGAVTDYSTGILCGAILGLCWELYSAQKDLSLTKESYDLSDNENKYLKWVGAAGAITMILPGYLAGIAIGLA